MHSCHYTPYYQISLRSVLVTLNWEELAIGRQILNNHIILRNISSLSTDTIRSLVVSLELGFYTDYSGQPCEPRNTDPPVECSARVLGTSRRNKGGDPIMHPPLAWRSIAPLTPVGAVDIVKQNTLYDMCVRVRCRKMLLSNAHMLPSSRNVTLVLFSRCVTLNFAPWSRALRN